MVETWEKLYRNLAKVEQCVALFSIQFQAVIGMIIIIVLTLSHHRVHFKMFGDMYKNRGIKNAACYDSAAFPKQI